MMKEAKGLAEKNKQDSRREVDENLALSLAPIRGDHKNIAVACQVAQKDMCETPVLVSKIPASLTKIISND